MSRMTWNEFAVWFDRNERNREARIEFGRLPADITVDFTYPNGNFCGSLAIVQDGTVSADMPAHHRPADNTKITARRTPSNRIYFYATAN